MVDAPDDGDASTESVRRKLVDAKERWARERRLITGVTDEARVTRLPPGQQEVRNWPVLDLGIQPDVPPVDWKLRLDGLVVNPVTLDHAQFMALPQSDSKSDIHCVTRWSRYDNHWQGVSSGALLALVRPKDEARHVIFHAHDGYTTNVSLEAFAETDVMLAHSWEGSPLTRDHGGPVRVVIPHLYFWKSAKWVRRIEFSRDDRPGFWEVRGYHNVGDPWKEERYE
jgi:DMSO/TMAO reductase YedYZ molybdopterin-dependent catalytic subunit